MIWFTSDTHYWHRNIIEYCQRPFGSVEEMNEELIERWNQRVSIKDTVYHLGDFALSVDRAQVETILSRLNGHKHLIVGNHDEKRPAIGNSHWQSVSHYKRVKTEGQRLILCHYPMKVWHGSHKGAWQLHGHCHGSLPRDYTIKQLDVGVDCWGWAPISYEEVAIELEKHEARPVDHHRA